MADVVVVLGIVAFFAVTVLFVRACDRIIGPESATASSDVDKAAEEAAA